MLVGYHHVTVIGKQGDHILPCTDIPIQHIRYCLVDNRIGLNHILHRETAYSDINLVALVARTLAVIKEAHIVLKHIGVYRIHGVLGLIAKEIVALLATRECDETVIKPRITKEKQIFGSLGRCRRAVIKHLHKATVGSHIGSAR